MQGNNIERRIIRSAWQRWTLVLMCLRVVCDPPLHAFTTILRSHTRQIHRLLLCFRRGRYLVPGTCTRWTEDIVFK